MGANKTANNGGASVLFVPLLKNRNTVAIKLPEPFGYFKAEPFGWRDCAEGDEGATALYDEAAMREAIAAAVAVEREACAKECDTIAKVSRMRLAGLLMGGQYNFEDGISEGADLCTQAIRARGENPSTKQLKKGN